MLSLLFHSGILLRFTAKVFEYNLYYFAHICKCEFIFKKSVKALHWEIEVF